MMRDGGLIERKAIGEVAHADVVVRIRELLEDLQAMRVGERFEKRGIAGPLY